ncbi:DEP domain-containing mTOR-interacting protein-like isoform X1 [Haliotis rubra]|uniref:DEP domain-containing mTOR-interacting protein-like isoform X1 n=1 Tax=Haliotis rubra TaxID=36100 RepID=UPI001EE5FDEC|nr:DEP domain-containing mTOR-interacting protein-like isoform X1 [Haliotis rubra]
MLRRQRSRIEACKYKILLVGEQLRFQMHVQHVIEERRFHFRNYKACFVGRDAVDWLILNRHAHTREEAMMCMGLLQDQEVIHHVCDDHSFKDEHLFYRFRRDDETYLQNKDLRAFFKGQHLFDRLFASRAVLRDFHAPGVVYRDSFMGRELIDWMLQSGLSFTRDVAIKDCRELLENDVIKHVTDDYHFRDDDLIYQFSMDFHQPYLLSDILSFRRTSSSSSSLGYTRSSVEMTTLRRRSTPVSMTSSLRSAADDSSSDSSRNSLPMSNPSPLESVDDMSSRLHSGSFSTDSLQPKSVLLRHVTVQELEDPDTPYMKHTVKMISDSVGYGFVIRGNSPAYVQTVDPNGPAAAAGIKVRQFIHSVNGKNVLRMDHKSVGKLIQQKMGTVCLVVMTHKRDAAAHTR